MFGCTMRSGVRESPLGEIPGALNIVVSVLPTKISSMASSLADCWRVATAEAVEHADVNQMSEMSSSVGPMPVVLSGDPENGMQFACASTVAGLEPTFSCAT